MTVDIVPWGADRLDELGHLVDAALPAESLGIDDLEALCFGPGADDPTGPLGQTVVLGDESGHAAILATLRSSTLYLQLAVVHPSRRRRSLGRELIAAAEQWGADRGARAAQVGGAAPVYLFTGVDTAWIEGLCCLESLGYARTGIELDLVCPTRGAARATVPAGVVLERVSSDAQLTDLVEWSERSWPAWTTEFARAGHAGTVVVARDGSGGAVLGAAAHSVGRLGVVGPVAVEPGRSQGGIGSALMAAVLAELSAAGLDRAEIAWVSTVRFYVRSCGATVRRASVVMRRDLPGPSGG